MDRFTNPERFCCFRRDTGLIIAASLEAVVFVGFLILVSVLDKRIQLKDGTFLDLSMLIAAIIFRIVIVVSLIVGMTMVSACSRYLYIG